MQSYYSRLRGESERVGEQEKEETKKGTRRRELTDTKLSVLFLRDRGWSDIIQE